MPPTTDLPLDQPERRKVVQKRRTVSLHPVLPPLLIQKPALPPPARLHPQLPKSLDGKIMRGGNPHFASKGKRNILSEQTPGRTPGVLFLI